MFVRLLGEIGVGEGPDRVTALPSRVMASVVAALTVADGRVISMDALVDATWEEPTPTARNAVQVAVSGLRKRMGAELIESGRTGYRIVKDLLRVDLHEAATLLADARRAVDEGRPQQAADLCSTALSLFGDDAFAGLTGHRWAAERERAAELERHLRILKATADAACGRTDVAVSALRAALAARPADEQLAEATMRVLWEAGRGAEALSVFEALRRALVDDFGADPSPAVARLFREILQGAPDTVERLAPAPRTVALPEPRGPLLGRGADLARIETAISAGHRLVTVLGPGGMGKTRLVVEHARAVAASGRPVVFLDLTPVGSPAAVTAAASKALGIDLAQAADVLSGRDVLVVVDNAEHVLSAATELVGALLAVPGTTVVVTSRSPLRLVGEHQLDLNGVDDDAALDLLVQKACLSSTDADGARDDLRDVARLADGVPLVIELIAPTLLWHAPRDALKVLDLELLRSSDDSVDRPSKHASVFEAVGWSVRQASPEARTALGALSVVRGAFGTDASLAVIEGALPGTAARGVLAELVGLSLVKRLTGTGPIRFRILEPIRIFARDAPEVPKPGEAVHRAHALHYLGALHAAHVAQTADPDRLDDLIVGDIANIRAAMDWAVAADRTLAFEHAGEALWADLWGFNHANVRTLAVDLLRAAGGTRLQRAVIGITYLMSATDAGVPLDRFARQQLVDIAEVSSELDDDWHRRWVVAHMQCLRQEGDVEGALHVLDDMRTTSPRARFEAATNRALLLLGLGRVAEVRRIMREQLDSSAPGAGAGRVCIALSNLGYVEIVSDQLDEAAGPLAEALAIAEARSLEFELATVRVNLAWLALRRHEFVEALAGAEWVLSAGLAAIDWVTLTELQLIAGIASGRLGFLPQARGVWIAAHERLADRPEMVDEFLAARLAELRSLTVASTPGSWTAFTASELLATIRSTRS